MTSVPISNLPVASALDGAELWPLVQSSTTRRSTTASLKTYTSSITATNGTTAISLADRFGNMLSVKDFGATGDGLTDDTIAVIAANAAAGATGQPLYWPAGTYVLTNVPLSTGSTWYGAGMDLTTLKLKAATNGTMIETVTANTDNVILSDMTFDGNSGANTGVTLPLVKIEGHKPEITNCRFVYAAGTALYTDYDIDPLWVGGALGRFKNLVFDTIQGHGWVHRGPNDSSLEDIYMVDIGLAVNNTYDGLRLQVTAYTAGGGNCRINSYHHNNRNDATNTPRAGMYVAAGVSGVTCVNSHFEGGNIPLLVDGTVNCFHAFAAYAPRGGYAIVLNGGGNVLSGSILNGAASANPDFKGININAPENIIDVFTGGPTEGNLNFNYDPLDPIVSDAAKGRNIVRMTGNTGGAVPLYTGTPAPSDELFLRVTGPADNFFIQNTGYAWTAYTPTITSAGGTLDGTSNVTKSGRYKVIGKTVFLEADVTVVAVGGGAPTGAVRIALPSGMTLAANSSGSGGEVNTGSGAFVFGSAGAAFIGVLKYDATTYWVNGNALWISTTVEIA